MSQEKKVSVGVEYNTNTVEYSDASVHSVSSAMYGKRQFTYTLLTFSLSFFRLKSINFLCDSKTPQHLI